VRRVLFRLEDKSAIDSPARFRSTPRAFLAEYFKVPIEAGVNTLPLSNAEERAECTKLYFEKTVPGRNVYFVLERVATAGVFHWPGTQLRPMYDSRFFGFSDATIVHCVE